MNTKWRLLLLGSLFTLASCGGGDSDDESGGDGGGGGDSTETGVFIDSPVINIGFRTATQEGSTDSNGEFTYVDGETITFFIGDLEFPATIAAGVITPLEIAGSRLIDDTVVNILRLLQTMDDDGNTENGITIPATAASFATQVDFSLEPEAFESSAAVVAILNEIGETELISSTEAVAHFQNEIEDLPFTDDIATEIPFADIQIDGDDSDWAGIRPLVIDAENDQNGNTSTDLVKVALADTGDSIAVLFQTAGDIALPHTPSQTYSHYEVGIHFFSNSDCDGNDNGFLIVNNFTETGGQNFHQLDDYTDSQAGGPTQTANSGSTLESSFSKDDLPLTQGNYISIYPYIQSFNDASESTSHDDAQSDVCLQLLNVSDPGEESDTVPAGNAAIVGSWRGLEVNDDIVLLTFFDDATYMHNEVDFDDQDEISGMELGAFSRNEETGQLTLTQSFDNNGDTGLTDFVGEADANVFANVINGNLNLTIDEDGDGNIDETIFFAAIATESGILSAWTADGTDADFLSIIFLDDGTYVHAEIDNDPDTMSGMEWGTYTRNESTGLLTVTQTFDNNGDIGLTDFVGNGAPHGYANIVDDKFHFTIDEDGDEIIDETIIFDPVP